MSAKHTPGPWVFKPWHEDNEKILKMKKYGLDPTPHQTNNGDRFVSDEQGYVIALVSSRTQFKRGQGPSHICPERDKNARLIASAPELLALVRSYHNTYPLDEYSDFAYKLISKAEGRD